MSDKKYHIITMGCQMNERDSETFAGMLEEKGYTKARGKKDADVVIINTCSVRENADKKFFGVLGQLKNLHEEKGDMVVAVCGCMMQQQRILDTIRAKYSWVDIIFGTLNINEFPKLLDNVLEEKRRIVSVRQDAGPVVEGLPAKREYSFKGFVNIMYGCNNFCSYCIVPYTRGRERSRRPEDILAEVRQLAESGCKEIMLLGQNVNSYGKARYEGSYCCADEENGVDFAKLLRMIDEVPGIERVRFMTSHPKDISQDLIDCYKDLKHLCKQIHLPVQAGSNAILKSMNRIYNRDEYLDIVKRLRQACPDIAISTDIIVGFPGETEEDFEDTLDLVRQVRYDSAFTFLYSVREGTPAAKREDQVPENVKHERFNRLLDLMHSIQEEKAAYYQDGVFSVLAEGPSKTDKNMLTGRTESNKVVDFPGSKDMIGKIVNVKITKAQTFSLYGEIAE